MSSAASASRRCTQVGAGRSARSSAGPSRRRRSGTARRPATPGGTPSEACARRAVGQPQVDQLGAGRAGRPARPARRTRLPAPRAGRPRAGPARRRRPLAAAIREVLKSTIRIRPSGSRSTRSALPVSRTRSDARGRPRSRNRTSVPSSSVPGRGLLPGGEPIQRGLGLRPLDRGQPVGVEGRAGPRPTPDGRPARPAGTPDRAPWSASTWITEPKLAAVLRAGSACALRDRNHCRGQPSSAGELAARQRDRLDPGATTGSAASLSGRIPHQRPGRPPAPAADRRSSTASASRASRTAACSRRAGGDSGSTLVRRSSATSAARVSGRRGRPATGTGPARPAR